jgi:Na+-transporting NADH:ubiquinone oxidoreductase subunit NqrB
MDAMTTEPLFASVRRHRAALTLLIIAVALWLPEAALAHEDQVLRL